MIHRIYHLKPDFLVSSLSTAMSCHCGCVMHFLASCWPQGSTALPHHYRCWYGRQVDIDEVMLCHKRPFLSPVSVTVCPRPIWLAGTSWEVSLSPSNFSTTCSFFQFSHCISSLAGFSLLDLLLPTIMGSQEDRWPELDDAPAFPTGISSPIDFNL